MTLPLRGGAPSEGQSTLLYQGFSCCSTSHLPQSHVINHGPTVIFTDPYQKAMGFNAILDSQEYVYYSNISYLSSFTAPCDFSTCFQLKLLLRCCKTDAHIIQCDDKSLTREERDTKSFGSSGSSGGKRESQESEAGVRGLGLQGFSLLLPRKWPWPQELMHTSASAASRSVYSRPEMDCSLSCLLLFTWDPQ